MSGRPKDPDPPDISPPSPTERAKSRASIATEGVRQVIWVNGGGAVALLALLQEIWNEETELAPFVLYGILLMALGIVLALIVPFIRVSHSRRAEVIEFGNPGIDSRTWVWWVSNILAYLSIALFGVACLVFVCGAASILAS